MNGSKPGVNPSNEQGKNKGISGVVSCLPVGLNDVRWRGHHRTI